MALSGPTVQTDLGFQTAPKKHGLVELEGVC